MRKAVARILVLILLFNLNCAIVRRQSKYPGSLGSCEAKYLRGSLDLLKGKKGHLALYSEVLQFHWRTYSLDIPLANITRCQVDEKLNRAFPLSPDRYPGHYTKRKLGPSFWESLLGVALVLIVAGGITLLIELSEDYVFLCIEFNLGDQPSWAIFKAKKKEFDKIWQGMKVKVG